MYLGNGVKFKHRIQMFRILCSNLSSWVRDVKQE